MSSYSRLDACIIKLFSFTLMAGHTKLECLYLANILGQCNIWQRLTLEFVMFISCLYCKPFILLSSYRVN